MVYPKKTSIPCQSSPADAQVGFVRAAGSSAVAHVYPMCILSCVAFYPVECSPIGGSEGLGAPRLRALVLAALQLSAVDPTCRGVDSGWAKDRQSIVLIMFSSLKWVKRNMAATTMISTRVLT